MMRASFIISVLLVLAVLCGSAWAGAKPVARAPMVMDFKGGAGAWKGGPKKDQFRVVSGEERGRKYGVARLTLHNERQAALIRRKAIDLSSYDALRFDAFVPKTRAHMHFALYFIDEDDFWFQTWRPLIPRRNTWNTFEIDLRGWVAEYLMVALPLILMPPHSPTIGSRLLLVSTIPSPSTVPRRLRVPSIISSLSYGSSPDTRSSLFARNKTCTPSRMVRVTPLLIVTSPVIR